MSKEKPKPRPSAPRRLSVAELRLWRSVTENVVQRIGAVPLADIPGETPASPGEGKPPRPILQ
jgi:hypothetical protein